MNCDLVFEILTRGPFPSGEPTDASVELHLARCHECRRLAEALRPAVELFHEALSAEEEADSLPGYYGALREAEDLAPVPTAVAAPWRETVLLGAAAAAPRRERRFSLHRAAQIVAGMALGAALCFGFALLLIKVSNTAPRLAERSHDDSTTLVLTGAARANEEARTVLASLHLPRICLNGGGKAETQEDAQGAQASEHLLCCTHCHNAAAPRRPQVSAVALLQREACGACHRWD